MLTSNSGLTYSRHSFTRSLLFISAAELKRAHARLHLLRSLTSSGENARKSSPRSIFSFSEPMLNSESKGGHYS